MPWILRIKERRQSNSEKKGLYLSRDFGYPDYLCHRDGVSGGVGGDFLSQFSRRGKDVRPQPAAAFMPPAFKPGDFFFSEDAVACGFFQRHGKQFFFTFAQEDNLVEAGYACNLSASTLERYADGAKQACIGDLSACRFSYSDGESWKTDWDENIEGVPLMLKINFQVKNESQEREFLVNIPISP